MDLIVASVLLLQIVRGLRATPLFKESEMRRLLVNMIILKNFPFAVLTRVLRLGFGRVLRHFKEMRNFRSLLFVNKGAESVRVISRFTPWFYNQRALVTRILLNL